MILGIDATNWVHVLWHASPGPGIPTLLAARLAALVDRLRPSHVVACFDRHSFRHAICPTYKANRKERDPQLAAALEAAPEAVADIATIAAEDGFEADDGLATLARIGRTIGDQVVLASPDKDLRQCLASGAVAILRNFRLDHGRIGAWE